MVSAKSIVERFVGELCKRAREFTLARSSCPIDNVKSRGDEDRTSDRF